MASPGYLLVRPLLDLRQRWAAFEAEWEAEGGETAPMLAALATALAACDPPPGSPLFLPVVGDMLDCEAARLETLRPNDVCFVLSPGQLTDPRTPGFATRVRGLSGHLGGRVGSPADADELTRRARDLGLHWAIVDTRDASAESAMMALHRAGLRLVASHVDRPERMHWAEIRGCALVSSDFLTTPSQPPGRPADLSHLKLLRLLALVAQDADSRLIEEIFKEDAKLSYDLLRLVNSVAVSPPTPIHSYHQAIAVLGRRQLQRWLQLLIYATHEHRNGSAKPLMHLAAMRGRLLELLAPTLPDIRRSSTLGDEAFMVGSFSLLEFVLNLPMAKILSALPLPPDLADALASRSGLLGEALAAVESGPDAAGAILRRLAVPPDLHLMLQFRALDWATRISLE